MRILRDRLSARIHTGIALLMLPLLVLMPLLHGHPLGAVGSDHPVGLHLPAVARSAGSSAAPSGGAVPSFAPGQGAAAEGGAPVTIVVQEPRPRGSGRTLSIPHPAVAEGLRAPVSVAVVRPRIRGGAPVERPQPWVDEQRPQAPPRGAAVAAA